MHIYVEERGTTATPWGPALQIQIGSHEDAPLSWEQVWRAFSEHYPGRWALQVFPPAEHTVNEVQA